MEHAEILLRTILAITALFAGTKLLGKQTISQMTTFDFVATITLGSITANLAINTSVPIFTGLVSFTLFVGIIYTIEYGAMKNHVARHFFAGDPTVVIEDGKILESNMRKLRYTIDYLNQQLRQNDVYNIEEVLVAIVEPNGSLTVLKKEKYRNVTRDDLHLISKKQARDFPVELVMDGQIMDKNLHENGLTKEWLFEHIAHRQLLLKDVMYAVLSPTDHVYIDTYRDHIRHPIDKE